MRLLAAPDKFRGTATAAEIAEAIRGAATASGWECRSTPVADGGEGTLEALGGANRATVVHGPLGEMATALWRLDGDVAVVEMAQASGLGLVGGAEGNDPWRADTAGTGELIVEAVRCGARRIIVALGGSASTDGGAACLEVVLGSTADLDDIDLVVACDVEVGFEEAAPVFGPQKGAGGEQVAALHARLQGLADEYRARFGVDVRSCAGAGAAGGLAGGLLALGGRLVPGFRVVADQLDLRTHVEAADLVVTGEGHLDEQSLRGKAVGGVLELCRSQGRRGIVIAGGVDPAMTVPAVSLARRFGDARARRDVLACVAEVTTDLLGMWEAGHGLTQPE
ncbi:MAG TPA: glycerate kinase [Acidimicrobiales bacterium]|nr:glycerate kinase [Acidimicrobiales bacterium]